MEGIKTETETEIETETGTVIKNDNDIKLFHKTEITGCQNKGGNK